MNYDFILKDGYNDRLPPILLKQNLNEEVWLNFQQNEKPCYDKKTDFCNIVNREDSTYVYAFGDSHFSAMSPQLILSLGTNYNYLEANIGGCPFALGFTKENKEGKTLSGCDAQFQQLRKRIINPNSIVILGGRIPLYLSEYYFDNEEGGLELNGAFHATYLNANGDSLFAGIQKTINNLLDDGHQVVLIYPIPEVGLSVPKFIFDSQKIRIWNN